MIHDDIKSLDAAVTYMEMRDGNPDVIDNLRRQADHLRFRSVPATRHMRDEQVREVVNEVFRDFWMPIIEAKNFDPEGHDILVHRGSGCGLSLEQIKLELFDYHAIMSNASRVYDELTWSFSKPNTDPDVIIAAAQERIGRDRAEDIIETIEVYAEELVADENDENIGILRLQAAAVSEIAALLRAEFGLEKLKK